MTDITRVLCKFVDKTTFENLPSSSVKRMKFAILDTLGCIIRGSVTPTGKACIDLARNLSPKECTIVGTNLKVPCAYAALVNGSMGHRFDYDDGVTGAPHSGITVIPAALAVADREQNSGKELITASCIGYELTTRISKARGGEKVRVHGNCFGSFGAAAAASKLMKLGMDGTVNTIGISGSLIPAFPWAPFPGGAMVKAVYGGWPAFLGILSAELASRGLTGQENILEDDRGFFQVFANNKFDENMLLSKLGKNFEWVNGHYFKPHAACRGTHVAVEAMLKMVREHGRFIPDRVEEIDEVVVIGRWPGLRGVPEPKNHIQAGVSIPYTVAAAAKYGRDLPVEAFEEDMLRDPAMLKFSNKVRVFADPWLPKWPHQHGPVEIRIKLKDGKVLTSRVEEDRGLKEEQVIDKFKELCAKIFSDKQVQDIIKTVDRLETVDNIKMLMDLLTLQ